MDKPSARRISTVVISLLRIILICQVKIPRAQGMDLFDNIAMRKVSQSMRLHFSFIKQLRHVLCRHQERLSNFLKFDGG